MPLPEIESGIKQVAEDASVLPELTTVQTLASVAEPLQGAAERLGRFADRLPRRAGRAADSP
jgi:hypothetical protein